MENGSYRTAGFGSLGMWLASTMWSARWLSRHIFPRWGENIDLGTGWEWQAEGATFAGHRLVCVTSEEKAALTIYDLDSRRHEALIELPEPPGSRLMAVGDDHIVVFDGKPRLLQLSTGTVADRWEDLDGGKGLWQPSVNMQPPAPPWLARDPGNCRFALGWPDSVVVVSLTF